MPFALPQLDALVLLVIALGLTLAVTYVAKAFFGVAGSVLGKLPIVGGWIDASAHQIEQRIANTFGALAETIEAKIGASWHATARLFDHLGREIARHAGLLGTIAAVLPVTGQVFGLYRDIARVQALVRSLIHRIEGIGADVIPRIRTVERGIGADVIPRIRTVERELGRVIGRDLPSIRSGERAATRDIANLWKWARTHTLEAGSLAFVAAAAWALTRLGAGWIRCSNWRRAGKQICGTDPALVESLLADTLLIVGTLSLVDFAKTMVEIEDVLAEGVVDFWRAR